MVDKISTLHIYIYIYITILKIGLDQLVQLGTRHQFYLVKSQKTENRSQNWFFHRTCKFLKPLYIYIYIYRHTLIPSYFIYLTSLVWYIIFCVEPELYIVFPRVVVVLFFILYNSIVTTKAINYQSKLSRANY